MSARVVRIADSPAPSPNLMFVCPGCDMYHGVRQGDGGWTWNGDLERPTLSPSVLVTLSLPQWKGIPDLQHGTCHSFVRDGQIQFLTDSTHKLAGQTVPLPPVD